MLGLDGGDHGESGILLLLDVQSGSAVTGGSGKSESANGETLEEEQTAAQGESGSGTAGQGDGGRGTGGSGRLDEEDGGGRVDGGGHHGESDANLGVHARINVGEAMFIEAARSKAVK